MPEKLRGKMKLHEAKSICKIRLQSVQLLKNVEKILLKCTDTQENSSEEGNGYGNKLCWSIRVVHIPQLC